MIKWHRYEYIFNTLYQENYKEHSTEGGEVFQCIKTASYLINIDFQSEYKFLVALMPS